MCLFMYSIIKLTKNNINPATDKKHVNQDIWDKIDHFWNHVDLNVKKDLRCW